MIYEANKYRTAQLISDHVFTISLCFLTISPKEFQLKVIFSNQSQMFTYDGIGSNDR